MLFIVIIASLIGSVGTAILAAFLLPREGRISPLTKTAVLSYATGAMLAAALLGMIPNALR